MEKVFVLDTNVLLMDPNSIFSFEENDVVIPLAVVEEIDEQKDKNSEIGFNARETSRLLDKLRNKGKLNEGVEMETGGLLKIIIDARELVLPPGLSSTKMDNRILSTAVHLHEDNPDKNVILVSNDINLRLMADAYGLRAEEHKSDKLEDKHIISGLRKIDVEQKLVDRFYDRGEMEKDKISDELELFPQQFIQLTSVDNPNKTALGRFDGDKITKLIFGKSNPSGISPLNREQQLAFELLLNNDIKLVTLSGKAGTGKTLLALAAGLAKVIDNNDFSKLIVARPVIPMGKDIGYIPGDKEEKMQPWMQPIMDNLEFILKKNKNSTYTYDKLKNNDLIQIEALTYIRGRSLPEHFIIIDEAQNLSKHEVKTIVTRAGKNSKIVFTGDPYQIDNPYLNFYKNGLNNLAFKFKNEEIAGHIMLEKGERSDLARIASKLL